jgi:hypothetical protein
MAKEGLPISFKNFNRKDDEAKGTVAAESPIITTGNSANKKLIQTPGKEAAEISVSVFRSGGMTTLIPFNVLENNGPAKITAGMESNNP